MLYAFIPVVVLISALYFYPRNAWSLFYGLSVLSAVLGVGITAVSFFTFDTPTALYIPYVFSDFYLVTNSVTLYMTMGVYSMLLCAMLLFRHRIFYQVHHFEKLILLWLHTLFVIFAISAQDMLQILFAWAGCALCMFAISAYKDAKTDVDMPLYAFFAYILPLMLFIGVFATNTQYTWFGNVVFIVSVCSIWGVFPFNMWVGRLFTQAKLYAVVLCTLKTVLAVKLVQVYMYNMTAEFVFNDTTFIPAVAVGTLLIGAMVVYNQMDIFRRLGYIFGVFGSMSIVVSSVLPLPYAMVFMLYYGWIFLSIATILCVVHYVLSGERDICHMGGISQYAPILYVLYFVVMWGVGYVPVHLISIIMGKAVFVVDVSYSMYPIGGVFLIGQFVFCYGFGRMGALIFTQEGNADDMVTAYLKKPSKWILSAFVLVLIGATAFGFISNTTVLPPPQKTWQYGNVLYVVLVATSILGFVLGLFPKSKTIQISEFYRHNLYINDTYYFVVHKLLAALNRPPAPKTATHRRVDAQVLRILHKCKAVFITMHKSPYGMGYYPFVASVLVVLAILVRYKA